MDDVIKLRFIEFGNNGPFVFVFTDAYRLVPSPKNARRVVLGFDGLSHFLDHLSGMAIAYDDDGPVAARERAAALAALLLPFFLLKAGPRLLDRSLQVVEVDTRGGFQLGFDARILREGSPRNRLDVLENEVGLTVILAE
jgi:hypothetical protein